MTVRACRASFPRPAWDCAPWPTGQRFWGGADGSTRAGWRHLRRLPCATMRRRTGSFRRSAMDSGDVNSSPPIRVLLVDDHPAVREGLALLLAPEGIEVCAEAGGRADALARVEERRPDLAIVDLSLDGEDGLALISDLHGRAVPVLVYSMHTGARRVGSAFEAGALGYVTKRAFHGILVQGIREVAAGRRFVSP